MEGDVTGRFPFSLTQALCTRYYRDYIKKTAQDTREWESYGPGRSDSSIWVCT